jgi:hypothetical protein
LFSFLFFIFVHTSACLSFKMWNGTYLAFSMETIFWIVLIKYKKVTRCGWRIDWCVWLVRALVQDRSWKYALCFKQYYSGDAMFMNEDDSLIC